MRNNYDVNSLAVPRRAKEAIGGIALLKNESTGHQVRQDLTAAGVSVQHRNR